jgi:hypothetical protein
LFRAPATAGKLQGIAVDDTSVYWASAVTAQGGGVVSTCSKSACGTPTTMASGTTAKVDDPVGVAVDDSNVYWVNSGPTADVYRCPKSGSCAPSRAYASGPALGLGALAGALWIGDADGKVTQVEQGWNRVRTADNQKPVFGVASDGRNVFWADESAGTANIYSDDVHPVVDTEPGVLVTEPAAIFGIAISAGDSFLHERMYWITGDAQKADVWSCTPNNACTPAHVVELPSAVGLATDASWLYATVNGSFGGAVLAIPAPP